MEHVYESGFYLISFAGDPDAGWEILTTSGSNMTLHYATLGPPRKRPLVIQSLGFYLRKKGHFIQYRVVGLILKWDQLRIL